MTTITSRRAVLAGAAALPALAMPAIASSASDPLFAAIEHHRIARAAFWDESVSEEIMAERGKEADQELADLLATRPTTVAGMVAVLRYLDHHLEQFEDGDQHLFANASDPVGSAGKAFLVMIAAALEAAI